MLAVKYLQQPHNRLCGDCFPICPAMRPNMLTARTSLGVVFFPAFDWGISPTHPEREERLLYTQDQFKEEGIFDVPGIDEYTPEVGSFDDVNRVHFCVPDAQRICGASHLVSLGGAIRAGELVFSGEKQKALALVRPPGHHAMKVVHGNRGFCDVNITAIMVEYLREKYGPMRVAIVDTDCHHSDGITDVYWNDPDTLVISMHQDPRTIFPGTGFPLDLGGPNALGATINIPLPAGTGDSGYIYAIDNVVLPILDRFKPNLVVNAAGQDSHFSDPLTNMNLTSRGYAEITRAIDAEIVVLEGGYAIHGALPYTNLAIALALSGLDPSGVAEPGLTPNIFRRGQQIGSQLEEVCEEVLKLAFDPPRAGLKGDFVDGWYSRAKDIYYDTDRVTESQIESVRLCSNCPGLLHIDSWSTVNPLAFCLQIPQNACPHCRDLGYDMFMRAKKNSNYRYLKLINRLDKEYLEQGF